MANFGWVCNYCAATCIFCIPSGGSLRRRGEGVANPQNIFGAWLWRLVVDICLCGERTNQISSFLTADLHRATIIHPDRECHVPLHTKGVIKAVSFAKRYSLLYIILAKWAQPICGKVLTPQTTIEIHVPLQSQGHTEINTMFCAIPSSLHNCQHTRGGNNPIRKREVSCACLPWG